LSAWLVQHVDISAPVAAKLRSKELTYDAYTISQQLKAQDEHETSETVTLYSPKFLECIDDLTTTLKPAIIYLFFNIVFLGIMAWMLSIYNF
jgi:hypothetical protein